VSVSYLYAVLDTIPRTALGEGLAGEPVRAVRCADVVLAVGAMTETPAVSPEALRRHDAVVRRLADAVDAVLPARFGASAPDERSLCERLERTATGLREALAQVSGREQMILRVYASTAPAGGATIPGAAGETAGEGTRYLLERARRRQAEADVAELAPLRPVLARLVTAERVERHHTPPLVASVYHLVPRGTSAEYTRTIEEAARPLASIRVTVSGPWAPYAFAPVA
jgi:hypothetical protein